MSFLQDTLKKFPALLRDREASAENGIRSALIRNLLENSLLSPLLPNTARLCQLFFLFRSLFHLEFPETLLLPLRKGTHQELFIASPI